MATIIADGRPSPTPNSSPLHADASSIPLDRPVPAGAQEGMKVSAGSLVFDLELVDGEWIAVEPRTGMYGEGDDDVSATLNLLRSLDQLREELRGRQGALAPDLALDLEYLERHLWP